MFKAALIAIVSVALPGIADARPATDDDVEMYVKYYTNEADEALDTCAVFESKREISRCMAVHMTHWAKTWQDNYSIEWSERQYADMKKRKEEVDQNIHGEIDSLVIEKKEDASKYNSFEEPQ